MNETLDVAVPERAPSGALSVSASEDAGALLRLGTEWDALVARSPEPSPFLTASWLHAWWMAFGKGTPVVATVRDASGTLVGAALFSQRRARFHGMPVRLFTLGSNVHSNRPDFVVDAAVAVEAAKAIARFVHARRRRWTVCFLDHVPVDSIAVGAFRAEMERLGHVTGLRPKETPPFIRIGGGYEPFLKTLAAKWKSNLRNREKRFAALGEVAHETIREALPDLESRLQECFALENKGWKGAAGSAIVNDPATLSFYVAIAKEAAQNGTLALQTLRTNGRLAAFQLDLISGGVEYVLKIGYEPELGNLSPGALLMRRTIEQAAASGLQIVDLLGDDMPWKRDWTKDMRPHVRLLAFGKGPAGVALSALEFGALPRLREMRDRLQSKKNSSGGTA